jgi:hypothetical protein
MNVVAPSTIADLPSREMVQHEKLCRKATSYRSDPLGFVQWAYPWGEPGPLEKYQEGASKD